MAAEEIAVDPFKERVEKLRMLAENSQDSKLDRLVLTAMYQAMTGQAMTGQAMTGQAMTSQAMRPSDVAGNDQTIGNLAA